MIRRNADISNVKQKKLAWPYDTAWKILLHSQQIIGLNGVQRPLEGPPKILAAA